MGSVAHTSSSKCRVLNIFLGNVPSTGFDEPEADVYVLRYPRIGKMSSAWCLSKFSKIVSFA